MPTANKTNSRRSVRAKKKIITVEMKCAQIDHEDDEMKMNEMR